MYAEIVSIGDEILIGQIINTNAVFIAKELNKVGIEVAQITSISEKRGDCSLLKRGPKKSPSDYLNRRVGPNKR